MALPWATGVAGDALGFTGTLMPESIGGICAGAVPDLPDVYNKLGMDFMAGGDDSDTDSIRSVSPPTSSDDDDDGLDVSCPLSVVHGPCVELNRGDYEPHGGMGGGTYV